ncbi:TonB-dependent receptor [Persicobacter psychrovividus]|uniref:SusC/RagA family TonB-linked outer membrane protein n=1 Tax=Persicobacter psychrovividus TaxID=387638 RepID=A0ABM7VMD0_9BACT|nr:SusC/RagA family TonB-linked outer membrane protein [Persicobacter psychrovividus]
MRNIKLLLSVLGLLGLINPLLAQQQVKGRVVDPKGAPIIGVNVFIVGTNNGTFSDLEGAFTLPNVNKTDTISFSFVGYNSKSFPVGNQTFFDVVLKEDIEELQEVVVVGFGEQKKENVTGSIEIMKADQIESRPVSSATQALQGNLPGLVATQSSGQPGADGMSISIRGASSMTDTDPLVIVDGMPSTLSNVNPQDIASITVLKDASATAIYGARAAGGVILVTTKRGTDGKVNITYSGYGGVQTRANKIQLVDAVGFMEMRNEALQNDGLAPMYPEADINKYRSGELTGTDWQNAIFSDFAAQQQHTLSISGGNESVKYYSSLSYLDQDGLTAGTNFNRFNLRLNVDGKVNERLKTHLRTHIARSVRTQPTRGIQQSIYNANSLSPMDPIRHENGQWNYGRNGNPVRWLEEGGDNISNWNYTQVVAGAEYQIASGLTAHFDYNFDYTHDYAQAYRNKHIYYNSSGMEQISEPNYLSDYNSNKLYSGIQTRIQYEKHLEDHYLKAMVGFSRESEVYNQNSVGRYNFLNDGLKIIDAGSGDTQDWRSAGTAYQWAIQSTYARLNYAFKDRYLFEGNVRVDGSSRFGENNRYGVFPSFSLGWRINEEAFIKDNFSNVNNLKLRGSWGQVGNQNIGLNEWAATLSVYNTVINNQGVPVAYYNQPPNPNIQWETKETANLGLEFDLWNNLLGGTVDVFQNTTRDILMTVPVPDQSGYDAPRTNAGVVASYGWEISLRHQHKIGQLGYRVNLNMSDARNEVKDLKGTGPWIDGHTITDVGYAMNSWYGFKSDGLYQSDEEARANEAHWNLSNEKLRAGDIKIVDINNDGQIDGDDRVVLGDPTPRYVYGANFGFNYKGWDLNLMFQGVLKRDVVLYSEGAMAFFQQATPHVWMQENAYPKTNNYPLLREDYFINDPGSRLSNFWVQDGSYLRLKNLSVGYTFDSEKIKKLGLNNLRIYTSVDNLWTLSNLMLPGIDPEVYNGGRGDMYPQVRTATLGINVSF